MSLNLPKLLYGVTALGLVIHAHIASLYIVLDELPHVRPAIFSAN